MARNARRLSLGGELQFAPTPLWINVTGGVLLAASVVLVLVLLLLRGAGKGGG